MMKKANGKTRRKGKGRRAGFWVVSLVVSIQVLGLVLFSMATPGPVGAETFTVNSTVDEKDEAPGDGVCRSASGYCTLRAAIQEANWLDGPDSINLKAGLYMLTIPGRSENGCETGDLDIYSDAIGDDSLTITGMDAKNTIINGGKLDRIFNILSPVSVTIAKVTIQNGLATDGGVSQALGGGILTTPGSMLTVEECTISNNAASHTNDAYGGGIYSEGTLKIIVSNFRNNSALSGRYSWGGGIYGRQAVLTITGSSLSNNSAFGNDTGLGGGISSLQSSTVIKNSSLSNNSASGGQLGDRAGLGGGICNVDGPLTITRSSLSNNSVSAEFLGDGGGIYNVDGTLKIKNSSLSNNSASAGSYGVGGGIYSQGAEVIIRGSTLSQNAVSGRSDMGAGGGVYLPSGTLRVRNETRIIRNFASDKGGGICYAGSGTGSISADSKVAKNIPDNIYP